MNAGTLRRRARHIVRSMPLRVRLVAALMLLVVLGLGATGIAASTILRSYLVGRVDDQLRAAANSSTDSLISGTVQGRSDGGPDHEHHALPSAYVVELLRADGTIFAGPSHALIDESQPLPRLPRVSATQSATTGLQLRTIGAVSGTESWRLVIAPVRLSDGTTGTALIAQSLGDVTGTVDQLLLLTLLVGAVVVVALGGVGYVLVRASLRPLREVERTAAVIAAGDLTRRVPHADRRTEIGSLASSLNTMLGEIEDAFAARADSERTARASENRMRQFVADASHELRTPLTTIRGFAELYRQAGAADPSDTTRYMNRIESEAARMSSLVEDLLLLARLDQQRPLRADAVDLLAVVTDAVHDTRAVAPGRRISLTLGTTDPPPVITGDDARIRQVLANLLSNAVTHTPPGTAIDVTLSTHTVSTNGDRPVPHARITVADDGPGLSDEQRLRIFERFYRGDSARGRGGAGLGLSIVAALVTAHHGMVGVESDNDAGARFTVELPLAPEPASGG